MTKKLFLPAFIFLFKISPAQNLVLNPGLDQYITCPGFGQFNGTFITGWDKPSVGSSDYYHFNCAGIAPTEQQPHSGEGYAGIICYNYGTEYREYITGTFSSPLAAGTNYQVKFFVSLHDGYIQAIKEVGAYISAAMPGPFSTALHINATPQIENTSGFLTDTANWKIISGTYTAVGGEQYITIGNFNDDLNTSISQPGTTGSFGAYYFVDAVSVTPDSLTSVDDELNEAIKLTVNNDDLLIQLGDRKGVLKAYTLSGKKISQWHINKQKETINISAFKNGLYFFVLNDNRGKTFSSKVMKIQ